MIICIAGKNAIAVNAVNYIIENNIIDTRNLFVLPNKNDHGNDEWQPSLKKYAKTRRLRIIDQCDLYEYVDLIFFSLEYDKIILPKNFRSMKLFNIHFSLLPKYKGMYTSVLPILNGETRSGVTLHKIDEGIDTGDIIDQTSFDIEISENASDLYNKYLIYGFELFKNNINKLITNNYFSIKQSQLNSSYFSKGSIDFKNIEIDTNKTSFEIHNQLRAYIFPEYQLPKIFGYYIRNSVLTEEKINNNEFRIIGNRIFISGIDGYKIIATIND